MTLCNTYTVTCARTCSSGYNAISSRGSILDRSSSWHALSNFRDKNRTRPASMKNRASRSSWQIKHTHARREQRYTANYEGTKPLLLGSDQLSARTFRASSVVLSNISCAKSTSRRRSNCSICSSRAISSFRNRYEILLRNKWKCHPPGCRTVPA